MSGCERPLLVIDAGNSRVKLGLFDRDQAASGTLPECHCFQVFANGETISLDAFAAFVPSSSDPVSSVITGSSPASIEGILKSWNDARFSVPVSLEDRSLIPVKVNVDEPEKVGIDRLLNAVAANTLRNAEQSAIIVDSGTATTVDFLDARGTFLGGAILPGLRLSARALHDYTQLLPLVELDELEQQLPPAIGKNTRAAIQSGLFWGQLGAIRELTGRLAVADPPSLQLLSGGGGAVLRSELSQFRFLPHLSLQGFASFADSLQ